MKYYLIHFTNPETGELIFNIELINETNELKINYGEKVRVDESARYFFNFLHDIFTNSPINVRIPKGTIIDDKFWSICRTISPEDKIEIEIHDDLKEGNKQ